MKKYKNIKIIRTGSKAISNDKRAGNILDVILIHGWHCKIYFIGKEISKNNSVAIYYNKFWRLGILDRDLCLDHIIENNTNFIIKPEIEAENKIARNKKLKVVFLEILNKKGFSKSFFILVIFIINSIFKKMRL